jgi:tetratricopeptide (TPR) repeat protein
LKLKKVILITLALLILLGSMAFGQKRLHYGGYISSAKIYLGLVPKDYKAAAEMLEDAIKYYPDKPPIEAHFILGTIYSDKRLYDKMIAEFNYVSALCDTTDNNKVKRICNKEKYAETIEAVLASNWIELYNNGVNALKNARTRDSACMAMTDSAQKESCEIQIAKVYEQAMTYFENATMVLPDSTQAWVNIGLTKYELGDVEGALDAYRQAIQHNPEDVNLLINIVSIFFNRQEFDSAVHYSGLLLKLDIPDVNKADIMYNMALAMSNMDNVDSAITLLEGVVELTPESEDALYNLGAFRIRVAADLASNLNDFRDSADVNKKKYQPIVDSLETELRSLYASAGKSFEAVVQINPNNADALDWLGNAYFYMEEWDKSLEAYEKLLAIDPENENAVCQLLLIYLKKNDKAKIKEYKEKCPLYQ